MQPTEADDVGPRDLVVTAEFFDYLVCELERPARVNPKMVELLRETRGSIRHG